MMGIGSMAAAVYEKNNPGAIAQKKREADQKKIDEAHALRQYEYEKYYEPKTQEYAQQGLQASGNVLEQEMAKLRMRLGYNQSAGAGTGGWWNLARGGMETAGMQKGQELASGWKQWEGDQWRGYMGREDQQAHQLRMADLQYRQQLELMRQQAELNDPAWWETLGSIVGMSAGMWMGSPLPFYNMSDPFRALAFQFK